MARPEPVTLGAALAIATRHWQGRPGEAEMVRRVRRCMALIGPKWAPHGRPRRPGKGAGGPDPGGGQSADWRAPNGSLDAALCTPPGRGVALLGALKDEGLSPKTVAVCYAAFRRALELAGVPTPLWPNAPAPPRRTRDALTADDMRRLIDHLAGVGVGETADLARLLYATGMRVAVEALNPLATRVSLGAEADTLHIRGKGGHERRILVSGHDGRALLRDAGRLGRLRALGYSAHRKRWKSATLALGLQSLLPTPHAVRHAYATECLRASGDLPTVQALLGHADINTTARYLSIDRAAMIRALSWGAPLVGAVTDVAATTQDTPT